jgi:hypothetical protein
MPILSGGISLKNVIVLFFIGLALVIFHSLAPEMVPFSLDMLVGGALLVITVIVFIRWMVLETQARPAIEHLEPNEEDLRNATPEILYLLEDGWGVKKIVDMISANYQMPPKMVYEHVMELMSTRQESLEFAQSKPNRDHSEKALHMGRRGEGQDSPMEIYYNSTDEE